MNVIIDRKSWKRGVNNNVFLRDDFGMQCCLGFAMKQICGLSNEDINGVANPEELELHLQKNSPFIFYDRKISTYCNTKLTIDAIEINDNTSLDEDYREQLLTELFTKNEIDITFEN